MLLEMRKGFTRLVCAMPIVACCLLAASGSGQSPLTKAQADSLYPTRLTTQWMNFALPRNWPGFAPAFQIFENPEGKYFADLGESVLLPPGYDAYPVYYVDPQFGADSKSGSGKDRAFRTISKALSMPGNKRILCRPGVFDFLASWRGYGPTGNVVIMPWDESGPVISSAQISNINWSSVGNGVYTARCSTYPHEVVDETTLDSWGNGVRFRKMESRDDVFEVPGSFHVSGKQLTLRTRDGLSPTESLLVFCNQSNGRFDSNGTLFVKNFIFKGGFKPFQSTALVPGQTVAFVDCKFQYSLTDSDGFAMEGPGMSIALRCVATGNHSDGFDYRHGRQFVEVDCAGVSNGLGNLYLDNGTTAHFGSVGITVGGLYTQNKGRNIHDVFDSKRLLLGATVGQSRGIEASNADICSGASTTGTPDRSEIWALGIRYLHGSPIARSTSSASKIWYRNHVSDAMDLTETLGTIRPI